MQKNKKISKHYISRFWSYCREGSLPENLRGLNFNNLHSIDKVISEVLYPRLQNETISLQTRIKESFRYAINFWEEEQLLYEYESGYAEIALPTSFSTRDFYIHVWNIIFPNESYTIEDESIYIDVSHELWEQCDDGYRVLRI